VRLSVVLFLVASAVGFFVGLAEGYIFVPAKPQPLRRYFQPDNPAWHGAQFAGGVVCWKLLDPAKLARWSADYCATSTPGDN
jgi:hypothetical protein